MKILFAAHDLSYADHIALSYLSAVAKQQGHSTYFCTLEKEKFSPDDLLTKVAEIRPDVVAYSINIMGFQRAVELNQRARKIHNFVSILGGPQATFSPETFEESGMDAYAIGEGEWAFRDFLSCLEEGKSYGTVENLITPNGRNSVRSLITNLDEIPFPDRDLVLSNSLLSQVPKKTFYATRGCPYSCAYCANNYYRQLYKGKGSYVRRFSVERLIQEIELVKNKYRMEFVKFGDDIFVMRADKWLEEFVEQYATRIGIPFNCYLRIDAISDEVLKLLKRAGCYSVHLSVDSTSRHVREKILLRKMHSENITEKLNLVHKYGINTWVNFMLAAPESTLQDDLDTIEVSRQGKVTYASYSVTVPMSGTALHDYCVDHHYIDPDYEGDLSGTSEKSVLNCFSEKEKDIRLNVFLLGPILARSPYPLYRAGMFLIKHTPSNKLYKMIRDGYYKYSIENTIFKVAD
ncbi:MAG: radical SAM protein [Chloroflexota bacterium]